MILKHALQLMAAALLFAATVIAEGNTFYFQIDPQIKDGPRQVLVVGPAGATGSITGGGGFTQGFDLGDRRWALVDLPLADTLTPGTVESKGFKITSSAALGAYFLNQAEASADMAALIDAVHLGTQYVVAGYHDINDDQISVQATQDATTVTIAPRGGAPVNVMLNAGQTYLYSADVELTGSMVTADKPIAVQSGNVCARVPDSMYACDHLVEQIPSIDNLSTSYLVPHTPWVTFGPMLTGNIVRVVATADNTDVMINGLTVASLGKGGYYEGVLTEGVQINATHPVLVVEYLTGLQATSESGQDTDPSMAVVPGSDQWLDHYTFYPVFGAQNFWLNMASIVIPTGALSSLRVAGQPISDGEARGFRPIGATGFSDGSVSLPEGASDITADVPFALLPLGAGLESSYFTFAGNSFGHGPPLPLPPIPASPATQPPGAQGDITAAANTLFFQGAGGTLMLFGPPSATGSLGSATGFSQPFTLDANGYAAIDLPAVDALTAGRIENKGFWATSDQALNAKVVSTAAAINVLRGSSLGTDYVVPGYRTAFSGPNAPRAGRDQISVQAVEDNTTVTITPKGDADMNRVTLKAGQTFFYSPEAYFTETALGPELTGTRVTADKPIAVQAGSVACVPASATGCGVLAEQIPALASLSSDYLLPQTPQTGDYGNVMRVVAAADATDVQVNGQTVATLASRGDFYEGRVIGGARVTATHPVLVAEYLPSFSVAPASAPAMTIVPGVDRWLSSYAVALPPGTTPGYVSMVIDTGSVASLRVAGAAVDAAAFTPVGQSGYSYGSVDVSGQAGPFTVAADKPFALLISGGSGGSSDMAYLTYGGADFPTNPSTSAPPPGVPPHCNDDSAVVAAGGTAALPVLANDSAHAGGLRVVSVTSPTEQGGTVSINADGTVSYVPPGGYTGPDSFAYTAQDTAGATDTARVQLKVTIPGASEPDPTKAPPSAAPGSGSGPAGSSGGGGGASYLLLWCLAAELARRKRSRGL